jgi:hypothetical protein
MVNIIQVKQLAITTHSLRVYGSHQVKNPQRTCGDSSEHYLPGCNANGCRPVDYAGLGPGEPPKISWVATSGMRDSQTRLS